MRKIPIEVAPLPEQRAIVSKIEQLFSELDNGIANLKQAQAQLKVYRQAVLKKAFEGNWNLVELSQISNAMGGFAFKSKDFIDNGKYQIVRIGNVRPGILRLNKSPVFIDRVEPKIIEKYLLEQGDVVITLTGTRKKRDYGFTTLINKENLLLNQRIGFLRFNNNCLPKYFLYYSWTEPFKDQFFASETGNVGQGNVGMKAIRSTIIPLPTLEEQQAIVTEIETRLSVCDKVEQDIEENLKIAEALRQSILKKAFEGKLLNERELEEVRSAPDWEPAEVLLEKIRTEKAGSGKKGKA
jgi:type I restriction enzyme S subunit